MKFYQIALCLFLFNLSLSLLNDMHIFDYEIPADTAWQAEIENISQTVSGASTFKIDPTMIFGDFITGMQMFVTAVGKATVLLPYLLYELHVPDQLIAVLTAATWFSYVIGMLQFISGRSVKAYE